MLKRIGFMILAVMGLVFSAVLLPTRAATDGFVPITADNAAMLQPLMVTNDFTTQLLFNSDGTLLIEASRYEGTHILNLVNGRRTYDGNDTNVAQSISLDHTTVFFQNSQSNLYDLLTGSVRNLSNESSRFGVFSPDSKQIVTVAADGVTRLWDVQTGQALYTLGNSEHQYTFEQFTPDGKYLVTSREDGKTVLLLASAGEEYFVVPNDTGIGDHITFTPDGSTLINNGINGFMMWNLASRSPFPRITVPVGKEVNSDDGALVSPDGHKILFYHPGFNNDEPEQGVAYTEAGSASLWDISNPAQPTPIAAIATSSRSRLMFDPSGSILALYVDLLDNQSGVRLLDAATGEVKATLKDHHDGIRQVGFNGEGTMIITAGEDRAVRLWSWDGKEAKSLAVLIGNGFALSPDETTLATELDSQATLVYGIATAQRPRRPFLLSANVVPSAVSVRVEPSPNAAVVGSASRNIYVIARDATSSYVYVPDLHGWVRSNSAYLTIDKHLPINVLPVATSAEAAALYESLNAPSATPVPTSSGAIQSTAQPTPSIPFTATPAPVQLPTQAATAHPASAPEGFEPITASNVDQVALLAVLPAKAVSGVVNQPVVKIKEDGDKLLTVSAGTGDDRFFEVWDLKQKTLLLHQALPEYSALDISDDGSLLAYAFYASDIHVLDVNTGKEQARYSPAGVNQITFLRFSHNGKLLVSAGRAEMVTFVWNADGGKNALILPTHSGVIFSPDDSLVEAGSNRLYNTSTGDLVRTIGSPDARFLGFSPDGTLAATFENETVEFWTVATGESAGTLRIGALNMDDVTFSPDWHYVEILDSRNGAVKIWQINPSTPLYFWAIARDGQAIFNPDSQVVMTSNPLQLFDMGTGSIHYAISGYSGGQAALSPDGATLVVDDGLSAMVFGIPTEARPAWRPINGHIQSSGVNVRSKPDLNAPVIGYASDDVKISGRNADGSMVYLPELKGWIRSDSQYLDLGSATVADLPGLAVPA